MTWKKRCIKMCQSFNKNKTSAVFVIKCGYYKFEGNEQTIPSLQQYRGFHMLDSHTFWCKWEWFGEFDHKQASNHYLLYSKCFTCLQLSSANGHTWNWWRGWREKKNQVQACCKKLPQWVEMPVVDPGVGWGLEMWYSWGRRGSIRMFGRH